MKPVYLRLYDIFLSVFTIAVGFCLCSACLWVHRSGGYTAEKITLAFAAIQIPLALWLILAIGRGIWDILFPKASVLCPDVPPEMALARQQCRVDISLCPPELRKQILNLREQRKKDALHGAARLLIFGGLFLLYAMNPGNYDSVRIHRSVIPTIVLLVLAMIFPFFYIWDARKRAMASMRIEVQLLKNAPAAAKIAPPPAKPRRGKNLLRIAVLAAALTLLLYGFFTGGTADVLTKAANICTECIGLG